MFNSDFILKSEIKLVTYIDLVKSVAGVPSFLLIICRFCFKQFERYYSSYQMSSQFPDHDKSPPKGQKERKKQMSFCEQMKLFVFYENPITFMLGHVCRIKFCKKREKTQAVKQNMKRLSRRFDLKMILNKIDRFEIDIGRLMETKKPPDGRSPFNHTRDRWKKGPDKP